VVSHGGRGRSDPALGVRHADGPRGPGRPDRGADPRDPGTAAPRPRDGERRAPRARSGSITQTV
jgi:hypothetical protein